MEKEQAVLPRTHHPHIQLGTQGFLLGLEVGFLSSTTCWSSMLLPRPQISPVVLRPFRVLQHLTTRKAKYKAVKKIQAAKLQGPEGSIREERTLRKASGLALGEISRGGAGASSPVRGAASASRGPAPRDATSGHVTAARVPGRCGIRGRRERTARRPAVAREVGVGTETLAGG